MTMGPRSAGLLRAGSAVLIGAALLVAGCGDKDQIPVQQAVPPRHTEHMPLPTPSYPSPPGYGRRGYEPEPAPRYRQDYRREPASPVPPPVEYDNGGNPWAGRGYPQRNPYNGQSQGYGGYHRYRPLEEDRSTARREQRENEVPPVAVPQPFAAPWPGGGYGFGYGYGVSPYTGVPYWGAPYWGGASPGIW